MDDLASRQLAALDRVSTLLESRAIDGWLFGGWAVDFYAGAITRAHDDIDMAIWLEDLQDVAMILTSVGWRHAPAEDEDGGTGYERDGVRLELTYLVRDAQGGVFIPFREGPVPWDAASFADDVRTLSGVRSRVITLASLRGMKAWPRGDAEDAAKDRADLGSLARVREPEAPVKRGSDPDGS
jgi:Aminoglycoside-2''-adenylyltransferase